MSVSSSLKRRQGALLAALVAIAALALSPAAGASPRAAGATAPLAQGPRALQAAFAAAAQEFAVPEALLLAVSYNLSRWEHHQGAPSVAGGFGPMHLVGPTGRRALSARGDDAPRLSALGTDSPNSLERAARLLGLSPAALRDNPAQNIRGGAALLAAAARELGPAPAALGDWYGAVAAYSGAADLRSALDFADTVFETIQQGAERITSAGQRVTLAAQEVRPNHDTARGLALRQLPPIAPECPAELGCLFIPAAYQLNSADPLDYGSYDFAARPDAGPGLHYIVIHNTEIDYNLTLRVFQTASSAVSSHYVVRSSDGQVAQMVRNKNVAWHAGNWYFNSHAIGIEHEGVAIEGATWYTEPMYRASARLVRYLAQRYNIPIDRAHIIGHDEIPGPTPSLQTGMHWDPGPFWDWAHFMELLGAPIGATPDRGGRLLTIAPEFAANRPPMSYCYRNEATECRDVPSQPANFVYLYSAPDFAAPLITNPYITADPTRANNWANKAVTGQRFVRVARQGDWDGIFFGGQIAWLHNPGYANTAPAQGLMVTPRPGLESIPVYGRAYPEAAAYPADVAPQALTPIYTMPAGQSYAVADLVGASYYWAPQYAVTPEAAPHTTIADETGYYRIFFNHRFAFVRASDVVVSTERPTR